MLFVLHTISPFNKSVLLYELWHFSIADVNSTRNTEHSLCNVGTWTIQQIKATSNTAFS